jgi:hypothetical protein
VNIQRRISDAIRKIEKRGPSPRPSPRPLRSNRHVLRLFEPVSGLHRRIRERRLAAF